MQSFLLDYQIIVLHNILKVFFAMWKNGKNFWKWKCVFLFCFIAVRNQTLFKDIWLCGCRVDKHVPLILIVSSYSILFFSFFNTWPIWQLWIPQLSLQSSSKHHVEMQAHFPLSGTLVQQLWKLYLTVRGQLICPEAPCYSCGTSLQVFQDSELN